MTFVRRPFLGTAIEGWSHDGDAPRALREVPFPGAPLILNLGPGWEIDGERFDSFVAGIGTGPAIVRGAASYACIELHLTPLAAHRVLGVAMHELSAGPVELADVLPGARELNDRLRDEPSWQRRFDLVETFLLRRLAGAPTPPGELAWAWQRLRRSGGRTPIRELVEETGWSPRRLIARFREGVGVTPKTAARVIRFDRAAAALRRRDDTSLAELAYACGYYDQAHLNRDFRELAGVTPTAFAASINFVQDGTPAASYAA